jgi:hypothetical protein
LVVGLRGFDLLSNHLLNLINWFLDDFRDLNLFFRPSRGLFLFDRLIFLLFRLLDFLLFNFSNLSGQHGSKVSTEELQVLFTVGISLDYSVKSLEDSAVVF